MSAIAQLKNHKALLREEAAAIHIPYTIHVNEHVVKTKNGYVMVFKLSGIGYENADDEQLNIWHERLNVFYRNIARPNISIWQTVIRHREDTYPHGEFEPGFAHDLNEKYRRRIGQETLMVNDLYVAVVYRPQPGTVGKTAMSFSKPRQQRGGQTRASGSAGRNGETATARHGRPRPLRSRTAQHL